MSVETDLRALASELDIDITSVEFAGDAVTLRVRGTDAYDALQLATALSSEEEFGCSWGWSHPWTRSTRVTLPADELPGLVACLREAGRREAVEPDWRSEFTAWHDAAESIHDRWGARGLVRVDWLFIAGMVLLAAWSVLLVVRDAELVSSLAAVAGLWVLHEVRRSFGRAAGLVRRRRAVTA